MKPVLFICDVKRFEEDEKFSECFETLPEYRQEKINRLKRKEDKLLSLCAGFLIKESCNYFGKPNSDKSISYGENGKPYFSNETHFFFNVSHSGSKVMCIASEKENGCDVEKIRTFKPLVANRVCTPLELQWLSGYYDIKEKERAFIRLWTIKESYMKILGTGFALSPRDIQLLFEGELGNETPKILNEKKFDVYELFFGDDYCYSYCLAGEEKPKIIVADSTVKDF